MKNFTKIAIIIGAGPAGLTAAYELLQKTDIKPIILEADNCVGGISRTVNYKGNRIDIGGHRFFSKSDRVMEWWENIMPTQSEKEELKKDSENIMLVRERLSRIYYLRKFFDYPVSLNWNTIKNLGIFRIFKIGFSYLKIKITSIKNESSLEDFFINRFGRELYLTFFKDYTEKVWGVPCDKISSEWGAQRIKGLSISKVLWHALKSIFIGNKGLQQKKTETSLIERFLYPKFGPGQMWERVAEYIVQNGGEIYFNEKVVGLKTENEKVFGVYAKKNEDDEKKYWHGDYFFSTMAIKDLASAWDESMPIEIKNIATNLSYRDFMTVGLLLKKLKVGGRGGKIVPDNWVYIQEPEVKVGRVQIFNNWSPFLVENKDNVWVGLEYFVQEGGELWTMKDEKMKEFAIGEMEKIDFVDRKDILDAVVIRMPKTYPAYFGVYDQFQKIRNFTDKFSNLFLIGRNGMHRYNNQDHSMLTAMVAVDNIKNGVQTKDNIWDINTEKEYHEKR